MSFDFSTLVTDRTYADVTRVQELASKIRSGTASESELAEFNSAAMKGAYNHTDLNRVTAAMESLKAKLEGYGYNVPGYQRIKVPHVLPEPEPTSRLPEGYTELTYIESTGTQYIDTGVFLNNNSKVVADCEITYSTGWAMFLGSYGSSDRFSWWTNGAKISPYYGATGKNADGVTGRTTLIADKNTWSDGVSEFSFPETSFVAAHSMYLFSVNNGGNYPNAPLKLYSCQVYDNGTLIRDFVPCINPDGEVGLYDLVTAAFFGNSGTGSFGCDLDFANQTWQQIIDACKSNAVPSIWKVGDKKTMVINGTDYVIDIIGKTHDTYADGSGLAPLTLQLHDCYNTAYSMGVGSNNGGYSSTIMYKTTLPAIKALMPAEVQAAIVPVSKKTSVGSKGTEIEAISCEMFLLSEIEVYGEVVHSVSGEGNQYDYYKNGGNKIKNLDGNATMWRLRSPASASVYSYCTVNANASNNYVSAGEACGVSFAFCFGGTSQTRNRLEDENTENKTLLSYEKETELYDPHTWYEFDWPTPEAMTMYLLNVAAIRTVLSVLQSTPRVPLDMEKLMVQEANDIEQIVLDVYRQITIMPTTFIACGEALCGGDNL